MSGRMSGRMTLPGSGEGALTAAGLLFTDHVLLAGPVLAACALLVLAGFQKVIDPAPLVRATRSVGLGVPGLAVRLGALGEIGLGLWAALTGSRPALLLVAASYAAFTGFVLLARRRGGVLASCGCFGKADMPPTRTHAAVTGAFALLAGASAVGADLGGSGAGTGVLVGGGAAVPLLFASVALAAAAYAVLAVLPLLQPRNLAGRAVP